jgi:hypothetical protein
LDQGTYKTGQRAYNSLWFFVEKKIMATKSNVFFKQIIAYNSVGSDKEILQVHYVIVGKL